MTHTAAVVGGGIGGLAAAHGLLRAGWRVSVFERAPHQPSTGTGLGVWPSALRALDRLGLGAAVRAAARRQPSGSIRRPDGSRIATIDVGRIERRHGEPVYLISRAALLGLLADALPAGTVHYGAAVTDLAALRQEHDLVVGADGINSVVRQAVFPGEGELRHAGVVAWRGTVPLDIEAGMETWGRGVKFGLTPQEPGRANWYAMTPAEERDGDLAELRRTFGGWHDPIPAVLDLIEPETVLRHGLHYVAPLRAFATDDVALLGDAAHAMTPDLGQGACQAIIDAVALADALRAVPDIPAALRRYDKQRRPVAQRLCTMSLRVNGLAQMRRWLPVRDLIIRGALAFGTPG